MEKALFLLGPGDSGKSLTVKILKDMAGGAFTCSLPVNSMEDPRRLYMIVGKRLNVMTELTDEAMIKDGGFKTLISTEEPILIDPKYRDPFTYVPTAKHVFAANTAPRITDLTAATFNRLLLIPYERVFSGHEQDRDLHATLHGEIPGIINWALEGAQRLLENNGTFETPAHAFELIEQWRDEANPIGDFVRQRCRPATGVAVPMSELAAEFNRWHGGRHFSVNKVSRMLGSAGFRRGRAYCNGQLARALLDYEIVPAPTAVGTAWTTSAVK